MPELILFGGKGGVGKTTCAASSALHFASKGHKTLIICTDPAHSIGDSLAQKIGEKITLVNGTENLYAVEVNADQMLEDFKNQHKGELKKLLDTTTNLDEEDVNSLFDLPIPGMDEIMGFKTIVDLIEENKYEYYVVDTAPTGHALKLLNSPGLIDDWVKVMAKLRWKYKFMIKSFAGKYVGDTSDDFLMNLKRMIKRIDAILKDPKKCEFVPVTLPEGMPVYETEKLVQTLNKMGINIKRIVINNVLKSDGCDFCRSRQKQQKIYIEKINEKFKNTIIIEMPQQPHEIIGLESLSTIKDIIFK